MTTTEKPWCIGPTWMRDDHGFILPEKTLGWDIINWMYEWLRTPGGPNAGEGFIPTLEQARFIVWWYAVDDAGKFIYREGILRRMKGWGKDPIAGALALVELLGPVEFSHWSPEGNPIGKPKFDPWVQIAAVSHDQTKNTFTLFPSLVSDGLKEKYSLELNKTVIYDGRGKMIEGVTSSPLALEGKRPTFVILNETQWWVESNSGLDMKSVIEGNVTKSAYGSCRSLSICNAHVPGQGSVGENDWEAYLKVASGQAQDTGVLYDSLEAPPDTPVGDIPSPKENPAGYEEAIEKLRAGLEIARGDSVWLPIDNIISSVLDIRNPVSESRRKFLNQVNAAEDSWISPQEWDSVRADVRLDPGDKITLGFDGSRTNDHTALAACRVGDGAVFLLDSWNPADFAGGEVPREVVDKAVRSAFERYKVVGFRADVHEWESYVDQWGRDFKSKLRIKASSTNPVAFDMRGKKKQFAFDCERFLDAVLDQELVHDGNPRLRWYVMNAHRYPTNYDAVSIRKKSRDSKRKIDGAVAAVLAFAARQDYTLSRGYRGSSGGGGAIV